MNDGVREKGLNSLNKEVHQTAKRHQDKTIRARGRVSKAGQDVGDQQRSTSQKEGPTTNETRKGALLGRKKRKRGSARKGVDGEGGDEIKACDCSQHTSVLCRM